MVKHSAIFNQTPTDRTMNGMQYFQKTNKISVVNFVFVLGFVVALISCREDQALRKTTYHLSDTIQNWVTDTSLLRFDMIDSNGITREFMIGRKEHDYSMGTSYFMGIKTDVIYREYIHQSFFSNYADGFSFYLYPAFPNVIEGERIHFHFNELGFHCDFKLKIITDIYLGSQHKEIFISSEQIESDTLLLSTFEYVDSLIINDMVYTNLFHFQLNDLTEHWTDFTITDIFYAQKTGLIRYRMNNGLVFDRQP